jgi:protein SCO1/2
VNHTNPDPSQLAARARQARHTRATFAGLGVALGLAIIGVTGCASQDARSNSPAIVTEVDTDEFHGTHVDPPLAPAPVTLGDTDGNRVRLDQLRTDAATAVFFGFTNCHDVCPTTMADLAAARRSLPAATADDVDLVFITVDPRRDTSSVLRRWLDQFDPDIVGLRGPVQRVHRAEGALYASQSSKASPPAEEDDEGAHEHPSQSGQAGETDEGHTHPDGDPDGYAMDHTSVVYVFGPNDTTLIYTGGATPTDYADDLTRLLQR